MTPAGVVCINHHPITSQSRARVCTFLSTQNSNLLLNNLSKCYCIVLPSYFSSRVTNNFGVSWIMPSLIWTYLIINCFIFFCPFVGKSEPAFWIRSRDLGKKFAWIAFYLRLCLKGLASIFCVATYINRKCAIKPIVDVKWRNIGFLLKVVMWLNSSLIQKKAFGLDLGHSIWWRFLVSHHY